MNITKTKIGIAALVFVSFVAGGFAFSAYQVGAFGRGCMSNLFKSRCDLKGLEKGSPEWQAKARECRKEWREMNPEERQAKLKELKENMPKDTSFRKYKGRGHIFGHIFGSKRVNYQVQNLSNGVQITITSDDSNIVEKLQKWTARLQKRSVRCPAADQPITNQ